MQRFLSIYYTLLCVVAPILVLYSFFRNSITMTDTFIMMFYVLSLPSMLNRGFKVIMPYFYLFSFVLIHSGYNMLMSYDRSIFMRAMHLLNFIFFVTFYHKTYFKKSLGENALRWIAIASTLFLVVQQVARTMFGITISGNLFPQYAIFEADLENMVRGAGVYRLSSFFSEPGAYAVYVICALAHELFYKTKTDMRIIAFFCLGCILSTSNTAIACMALLMGFFVYTNKLFRNRNILLLFLALVVIYFVATPHIDAINRRIEEGRSFSGRFNGYKVMYYLVDNPIWGNGFLSTAEIGYYLAGIPRLFVYMGMTGLLVYFLVYLNVFLNTNKKILLIVFLFLNIGSDTFFGVSVLYYSCFIFTDYLTKREKIVYRNHQLQQRKRARANNQQLRQPGFS